MQNLLPMRPPPPISPAECRNSAITTVKFRAFPGNPVKCRTSGRLTLGQSITPSTALMLCISVRPIDLHMELISASERQLHDARLILETEINALRSHEALTIALQNDTIRRLDTENSMLRRMHATQLVDRSLSMHSTAFKAVLMTGFVLLSICIALYVLYS